MSVLARRTSGPIKTTPVAAVRTSKWFGLHVHRRGPRPPLAKIQKRIVEDPPATHTSTNGKEQPRRRWFVEASFDLIVGAQKNSRTIQGVRGPRNTVRHSRLLERKHCAVPVVGASFTERTIYAASSRRYKLARTQARWSGWLSTNGTRSRATSQCIYVLDECREAMRAMHCSHEGCGKLRFDPSGRNE